MLLVGLCASLCAILGVADAFLQLDISRQAGSPRSSTKSRARRSLSRRKTETVSLYNGGYQYLINASVGDPPQRVSLQLDTGSSDTWVPWASSDICLSEDDPCSANGAYDVDPDDLDVINQNFAIEYADDTAVDGFYISESLNIGSIKLEGLEIGLALDAPNTPTSEPFNGLMGVGFDANEATRDRYPNIVDELQKQGYTSSLAYSLWLNGASSQNGAIIFGGVDRAKYKGDLVALPLQKDPRTRNFREFRVVLDNINVKSAKNRTQYSKKSLAIPVVMDCGSTIVYLPEAIADDMAAGVGAQSDGIGGMTVPCAVAKSGLVFSFGFGNADGPVIQVDASSFVRPYELVDGESGGDSDYCEWGIAATTDGNPAVLGDLFLRSAYLVFDLTNKEVCIAQANTGTSEHDIVEIKSTVPGVRSTATGSAATGSYTGSPTNSRPGEVSSTPTDDLGNVKPQWDVGAAASASASARDSMGAAARNAGDAPSTLLMGLLAGGIVVLSSFSGALMVLL